MSEAEDDLRTTSDNVEDMARRLAEMEAEKQRLDPADPRADALSAESERLGQEIAAATAVERQIANEIAEG